MRIKIETLIKQGFVVEVGETIEDNNYPVFPDFNYIYKERIFFS